MLSSNFGTTDQRYEVNAKHPETVMAFDTDYTMDYADGPVPLPHVVRLRDRDDVAVYATGMNQTLRDQARIPGMAEIKEMSQMSVDEWVPRADRMRLLSDIHANADRYVVVDDVDLRQLESEGWDYYQPIEYAVEELNTDLKRFTLLNGTEVREYLKGAGSRIEQFPPNELRLDADEPYTTRVSDGVRTPAHKRECNQNPENRFSHAHRRGRSDADGDASPTLDELVDRAFINVTGE